MGYEGHAVGIHDRAERETAVRRSMDQLASTAKVFAHAGLPADIVSGGGTGSYDISSDVEGITEIQAGSYALMDTDYAQPRHAVRAGAFRARHGRQPPVPGALRRRRGHKSCTKDHGHPTVKGIEGATVLALNDEHATIADTCRRARSRSAIASSSFPSHIDPTMNLHDVVYALDGDNVVGVWPIAARGYTPNIAAHEILTTENMAPTQRL